MFKSALAATTLAAFSLSAHAATTIVQWDFESVTAPTGTSTTLAGIAPSAGSGTLTATHAAAATFSTPAGNGSSKSISANTWAVGDYWQFSFSTIGYFGLTVSFDQTGSNTGPRDFTLAYSTNGSTFTNVSSYSLGAVTWGTGSAASGSSFSFDLTATAPAVNNNANVFIRLIDNSTTSISGATVASGGTGRVDNFTVTSAVPEAGTSALLAAGLAAVSLVASRRRKF